MSLPISIRWSRQALESLQEGLGYIAMFNPEAARTLRDSILEGLERVRSFPKSARRVPEQADPLIREILRPPFRILFELRAEEIRILAIRRMERAPLQAQDLEPE